MPVTKTRLDEDQLNLPAFDDILTVVNKAHDQNTDLGTSASSFYIGTDGPRIKNNHY